MSRHDRTPDLLVVEISGAIASRIVTIRRSGIAGSIAAARWHRVNATRGSVTASRWNNGGVTVSGCGAGGTVTISRHSGRVRRAATIGGRCACVAVDGHITRNHDINRRNNCIARSGIIVSRRDISTAGRCKIGTDLT